MPINTTFTAAPLPTAAEAGDGPANMLAYAVATDDLHVLKATSVANRDTLYANTTAGTLVSCAALGIVWQKTTSPPTAAAWRVLSEIGPETTSGIVSPNTASGWAITAQWAQRINGRVDLHLAVAYSGSNIAVSGTGNSDAGNVTDQTICTLQSGWLLVGPSQWVVSMTGQGRPGASGYINRSDQTIKLADVYPGPSAFVAGNGLWVSATYPAV